jgi:cytochrome c oxidase assembly protein subunit 15
MAQAAKRESLVAAWLFVIAALVAVMIIIGGATRLTDSGLSIVEWRPISGALPPLSEADWQSELQKYRSTTEYQVQNRGMSLDEFKIIYWWEWGHRNLGRLIGVVFAIPFLVFLSQGRLRGRVLPVSILFALGGLQGFIGWWMVESGLSGRLDVASYRLMTHLGVAFVILAGAVYLALDALGWPRGAGRLGAPRWTGIAFVGLLFVQILLGALIAGARAGPAYADWPTIGGQVFPATYADLQPLWRNFFENHAALHFNHRTLGYVVAGCALALAWAGLRRGVGPVRRAALWVGVLALAQMILGIVTVVQASPLDLSLAHQGLAVALWCATIAMLRGIVWR